MWSLGRRRISPRWRNCWRLSGGYWRTVRAAAAHGERERVVMDWNVKGGEVHESLACLGPVSNDAKGSTENDLQPLTSKRRKPMRNANPIVRGFTACVISLCLSGWSLGSSAAAATIVVTTNLDVVDPPFNTGGLCGSGTVADLPGLMGRSRCARPSSPPTTPQGRRPSSLPLASTAATIVLTGSLFLCGGHTTLNGDMNGDTYPRYHRRRRGGVFSL